MALFQTSKTLNLGGHLLDLSKPITMGILNITPDSFYDGGKYKNADQIIQQVEKMSSEGTKIIDIGGYSTRPNATNISENEELERVLFAIEAILERFPNTLISIDTFRANIAERAVQAGAKMVNDISGGTLDDKMFETVARLKVPYILMHMKGSPQTMTQLTNYDNLILEMTDFFQIQIAKLREIGVMDIILDVGLGFAKTIEQNYELIQKLDSFKIFELPILVGASRKSMIWKKLHLAPAEALNGTTAVNTIALQNGANILRVHDVKEAEQIIDLFF